MTPEQDARAGCLRLASVILTAGGLFFMLGALFAPEKVHFTSEYGVRASNGFTIGVGFILFYVGGTMWRHGGWPADDATQRRVAGTICLLLGAGLIALAVWESDSRSFPSGRTAAVLAGVLVMAGGALAHVTARPPSRETNRLSSILGAVVVTLFAILPLALAMSTRLRGGGEISFLFISIPTPRWLDRMVLTFTALIFGAVAAFAWKHALSDEEPKE